MTVNGMGKLAQRCRACYRALEECECPAGALIAGGRRVKIPGVSKTTPPTPSAPQRPARGVVGTAEQEVDGYTALRQGFLVLCKQFEESGKMLAAMSEAFGVHDAELAAASARIEGMAKEGFVPLADYVRLKGDNGDLEREVRSEERKAERYQRVLTWIEHHVEDATIVGEDDHQTRNGIVLVARALAENPHAPE